MRSLVAALVTVVLWASAFVGIRAAGEELSPGALALGRLLVGSAALGAIVLIRREPLPSRRDLPGIVLVGVLWFGIYNVVLNEAEQRVDAGTASMLVNVGPILIALLAGVLLHEGFPRRSWPGSWSPLRRGRHRRGHPSRVSRRAGALSSASSLRLPTRGESSRRSPCWPAPPRCR